VCPRFPVDPLMRGCLVLINRPLYICVSQAGFKWIIALGVGATITGFYKRFRWAPLKTRKITYTN